MATLDSYGKFKDYCFRALGEDEDKSIKVNVTDKQAQDRIEDAIKKWQDFHFEGSTLVNLHKTITEEDQQKGYLEVPELNAITEILETSDANKTNAEIMDDIEYRFALEYADNHFFGGAGGYGAFGREMGLTDYYITREYLASMRYLFTPDKLFTFNATSNRLYLHGQYDAYIPPKLCEEFRLDNWVEGTGTTLTNDVAELPDGKLKGSQLENTDAGANPISVSFTKVSKAYPRGLRTFSVELKQGTYTGKVSLRVLDRDGTVVATQIVTPKSYWKKFRVAAYYKEGHINDFVFEISSTEAASNTHFFANNPQGYRNNFIILSGYATASPDDVDSIWESGWLKSYAIALLKWQWSNNIKKFDGVQMAGGVTLNGQVMYDEAIAEMEQLSEELETKWTAPPALMIG